MIRFTPANTRNGEKFKTELNGAVVGTVVECYFCPHGRTDYVAVIIPAQWPDKNIRGIEHVVRADSIYRA